MAMMSSFSIRMDSDIKKQSESLYNALGLNLTTAINVFLRKSIQAGGFPFDVRLDNFNNETVRAIKEADFITDEIKSGHRKPFCFLGRSKKKLDAMKYKFDYTTQFKKDYRKLMNQCVLNEVDMVIEKLLTGKPLEKNIGTMH